MKPYSSLNMKKSPAILHPLILSLLFVTPTLAFADHHKNTKIAQADYIPGTWKRTWTSTTTGLQSSMTKVIKKDDLDNHFIETITNAFENGKIRSKWQGRFYVEPVVGNMLEFKGTEMRSMDLKKSSWSVWKKSSINYLFQADEFFWNEVNQNLEDSTKRRFTRIDSDNPKHTYQQLAQRKLSVLEPFIGVWEGSVEQIDVKAYGIKAGTQKVKHTIQFNKDKTIMFWHWDGDMIDGFGAQSYHAPTGHIRTNYHTSTGNQINGKLISSGGKKFVWERSGNTINGTLYEKCLLDVSEPGVFKHKIYDRVLNGIAQPEEPVIVLKKVD